jgi:cell division protein FtsZ
MQKKRKRVMKQEALVNFGTGLHSYFKGDIMEPFLVEEASSLSGARIIAVGVGGGGGNMIGHMINEGVTGIEMIMVNTDAQVLNEAVNASKIQIGTKLTKGLGAGMKPEIGKDSALENYDEIRAALEGADIVFISAGLGGGTGTGAAPIVAQIAKEIGALTIAIVTKPFMFEGKKRLKLAEAGLAELKLASDSIVVIPNDKLLSIIDRKLGLKDSFKIVDSVLAQAVSGTSGVILSSGQNDINLDFADLQTVMNHRGMALMGVGEHDGDNAAYEAVKAAVESPLLDNMSINGAMGVLVHFTMHPDFPIMEIYEAMNVIQESADDEADIIFGTSTDESISQTYIKITIIATGFEKELNIGSNNEDFISQTPAAPRAVVRPRLVVGGDLDSDYLDIPAYMRQQQD